MQFRVPQNITMEDRIVGPLTAIQFGILVLGGGVSFFVFTSSSIPAPINRLFGAFFAVVTIIMAVGKFNGQPMYKFFRRIISFITTPKTRVWHHAGAEIQLVRPSIHKDPNANRRVAKQVTKDDIARLAAVIDSRGQTGTVPIIHPTPAQATPQQPAQSTNQPPAQSA